jgi:hypothetical protein
VARGHLSDDDGRLIALAQDASAMPDAVLSQGEDQRRPYRILRTPDTVIEHGHEKKITSVFGLS